MLLAFDNELLGVRFSRRITPTLRYHIDQQIPDARLGNRRNRPRNNFSTSLDSLISCGAAGDVVGRIVVGSPAAVIIEDLFVKGLVDVADVMLAAMVAALWAVAPDIVTVDEDISFQIAPDRTD